MTANSQFVSTDHGIFSYRDTGQGKPIVMLHGQGASKDVFEEQFASPLAGVHRLIAFDLIGCGQSDHAHDPKHTYTIEGMADAVIEALDILEIKDPILLGWSLGGHIALEMLHKRPDDFSGIMLCGVPPLHQGTLSIFRGFYSRLDVARALRTNITRQTAERFAELCFQDRATPEMVDVMLNSDGQMRQMMSQSLMYGKGADQREIAENCKIPMAVVNGSKDPLVKVNYINSIAYGNLWDNRCHMIMGAGHAPFLTAPNVFNMLLHRFATEISIGSAKPVVAAPELAKSA